jgi:hypothetical protein
MAKRKETVAHAIAVRNTRRKFVKTADIQPFIDEFKAFLRPVGFSPRCSLKAAKTACDILTDMLIYTPNEILHEKVLDKRAAARRLKRKAS